MNPVRVFASKDKNSENGLPYEMITNSDFF